jgi:hypothetical protein
MAKAKHDWQKFDPLIDNLKAQGWNDTQIAKDLGIGRQTLVDHLRSRAPGAPTAHPSTPEHPGAPQEHLDVPETAHLRTPEPTEPPAHQGTLEGHQEVMEDVSHSVPEAPHLGTEEPYQSPPEHLSTPVVHPDVSADDSGVLEEHRGVPARQEHFISTPIVHPGPPSAEDWELWMTIKARWQEIEKMLVDRQALLSTPLGTPGHTQKKTYVFDRQHIALIDRYAQNHRLDLKDVLYQALEEFFQRRGYGEG